jgi:hypothetical protein
VTDLRLAHAAQLELLLTAATLCIAVVGVVSGLFGMNLRNTHEDSYSAWLTVSHSPAFVAHPWCRS